MCSTVSPLLMTVCAVPSPRHIDTVRDPHRSEQAREKIPRTHTPFCLLCFSSSFDALASPLRIAVVAFPIRLKWTSCPATWTGCGPPRDLCPAFHNKKERCVGKQIKKKKKY